MKIARPRNTINRIPVRLTSAEKRAIRLCAAQTITRGQTVHTVYPVVLERDSRPVIAIHLEPSAPPIAYVRRVK